MPPQHDRLVLVALAVMLWWTALVSMRPHTATAFELPPFQPGFYATLEHIEMVLPGQPRTRAVEFWNGIVCREEDHHIDTGSCTAPADIGE